MTRRVVVTGATGFVGTALVERLARRGERVTALVRRGSRPDAVDWLRPRVAALVEADLLEAPDLSAAFDGADLVVHAAAVIAYRRRAHGLMQRVNVLGTRAVVAGCLAAGVGRLVHVSSVAAVGATRRPVLMDESTPYDAWDLRAPYFDTKHRAEEEVLAGVARGLDAPIVNPGAIYGPSPAVSNSGRVLAAIARGRMPVVPPGGMAVVPLRTVIDGVLAAAEKGRTGRRTVLAAENLSLAELVQRVGTLVGRTLRPASLPAAWGPPLRALLELVEPWVPDRVAIMPDLCAAFGRWLWFDTTRMRVELGVEAAPLDECLAATLTQLRRDDRL